MRVEVECDLGGREGGCRQNQRAMSISKGWCEGCRGKQSKGHKTDRSGNRRELRTEEDGERTGGTVRVAHRQRAKSELYAKHVAELVPSDMATAHVPIGLVG